MDPDAAIALLDNAVHRGETKPGSLAGLLGGEERFEEPRARLLVHAAAGVGHRQRHVRPWFHPRVLARVHIIHIEVGSLDGELPAVRHGVAGVHREIHHHLLDLPGIGHYLAQIHGKRDHELDVLAEQPAQHRLHSRNDLVQVQNLGLQHLPAAEGKKLPGEPRGTRPGLADLDQVGPPRVALAQPLHSECGVVDDDGE